LWLIGGGLVGFLIVLIGYFFFISPQRSQTSDINSRVSSAEQQNAILQSRINTLRSQYKNLAKYQADLIATQRALPSTSGVPDFLRTLQTLGSATQTKVTTLTVGPPADVSALAAAAPSAASTATTAPVPGPTAPAGPQIYGLTISAQVTGSPTALNRFLEQLQEVQPRAVLIGAINEGVNNGGPGQGSTSATSLQITMQAFVAPASAASVQVSAPATHK
jgi:type IV pilus assembly protein PilO